MDNINVLIVDDEIGNRSLLSELLRLNFPDLQIVGAAEDIKSARLYLDQFKIDLLLLDIEMPHGNGFELLKQLKDYDFEVIFITGFDQYAIDAIKVQALDYLLKPIDEEELSEAVNLALKRIHEKQPNQQVVNLLQQLQPTSAANKSVSIHTREKIILIRVNELAYLKADGTTTFYYLNNGKRILSTKPIGKNMIQLPIAKDVYSHGFYRCHSSYTVNLFYVKEFNKKGQTLLLENGEEVPVSQSKKELLLKLIS